MSSVYNLYKVFGKIFTSYKTRKISAKKGILHFHLIFNTTGKIETRDQNNLTRI